MRMLKNKMVLPLLFIGSVAFAGKFAPEHTDGVEPYYRVDQYQEYLDALPAESRDLLFATEAEMAWWKEARFGFFVHWNPSSMLECSMSWGRWGARPGHSSDGKVKKGIKPEIYNNQYKEFAAPKFDADEWIKLVKESGAKYFIFTTKHHDGFCMFDTKLTDYNVMNTPLGRDVLKELTDACHKYGIKVAFYYSQPDWNNEIYATGDYARYCDEYLFPQLRELMTNYGKVDVLWFDGLGKHPDTWKAPELIKMVKELQPGIILNHRWGPKSWHVGDYDGPEQKIGRFQTNRPWETCIVIGGKWGWGGDSVPMDLRQAISLLTRCAGGNGNLALNIGPDGDGEMMPPHAQRYREIGQWLKKHGDTIYGSNGGPYMPGPWGAATYKGDTLYLHVLANWSGKFDLPALPAKVVSAESLTGGQVKVVQKKGRLKVKMSGELDPISSVIAIKLDRPVADIKPIETVKLPLTIGATASASTEKSKKNAASAVVASDMNQFSEGIFEKRSWNPDKKDKAPWLKLDFDKAVTFDQVQLREGRFGTVSKVKAFELSAEVDGKWIPIHAGTEISGDFTLVLDQPVTATAVRLDVKERKGDFGINVFELFRGE